MKQKHSKAIAAIAGHGTAARMLRAAGKPFRDALEAIGMLHIANQRRKKSIHRQIFDSLLNAAMCDRPTIIKTIYTLPTNELRTLDGLIADIARPSASDVERLIASQQIATIMRNATARSLRASMTAPRQGPSR